LALFGGTWRLGGLAVDKPAPRGDETHDQLRTGSNSHPLPSLWPTARRTCSSIHRCSFTASVSDVGSSIFSRSQNSSRPCAFRSEFPVGHPVALA
jgi:hypothetical protein